MKQLNNTDEILKAVQDAMTATRKLNENAKKLQKAVDNLGS